MLTGIYVITSPSGGRYVGSSRNIRSRWSSHRVALIRGSHHSVPLQRAVNKYGLETFEFSLLESCDVAELLEREQHYLDHLQPEYNVLKVAGSSSGTVMSEAARKRLSELYLGKPKSETTRQRMSAYAKNREATHRARLAAALRGKVASETTRQKQRAAKLGSKQSRTHVEASIAARIHSAMMSSSSQVRGVSRDGARWCARISVDGRYKNLGRFATIEEAEEAVLAARTSIQTLDDPSPRL